MSVRVPLPDRNLTLETVIFDVNGTLTYRGQLLDRVAEQMTLLRETVQVLLVSSDTYGTLDAVAEQLAVDARRVADAADKVAVLREVGAATCAAVGNGHNDRLLLSEAAVGIAVLGGEGTARTAWTSADIVCATVLDAIGLVIDPTSLAATLRP